MARLPFEGIRVADFGWVITTPIATLWLATLGAEVIKIENAEHRDAQRRINFGGLIGDLSEPNGHGGFNSMNYSKYACLLDMSTPKGRSLAREIIKKSDVVVEAFTQSGLERFELTYEQLRVVKPDVIMLSNSSLGKTGPRRDVSGYGPSNQAYAGLPSMTGH